MSRALVILLLGCGCKQILGIEDVTGDAGATDAARAIPDAEACFGGGLLTVCVAATQPDVELDTSFDTTKDAACTMVVNQLDAQPLCVIVGREVTLLQARVTGTRPLVIIATDSLEILGELDISSTSASTGPGAITCAGDGQSGPGAGGGAGGSFGGLGGNGGAGGVASGGSPHAPVTPLSIIGGCSGGAGGTGAIGPGAGGAGGGAVYLIAGTAITINGSVIASGAGGGPGPLEGGGGGGGGAGGFIGIDAPVLRLGGNFIANGGGGGGGGDQETPGTAGTDGTRDGVNIAVGGKPATTAGTGGNGTVSNDPAASGTGAVPGSADEGGGGGGGSYGIIYVRSVPSSPGVFSPPLTTMP